MAIISELGSLRMTRRDLDTMVVISYDALYRVFLDDLNDQRYLDLNTQLGQLIGSSTSLADIPCLE